MTICLSIYEFKTNKPSSDYTFQDVALLSKYYLYKVINILSCLIIIV